MLSWGQPEQFMNKLQTKTGKSQTKGIPTLNIMSNYEGSSKSSCTSFCNYFESFQIIGKFITVIMVEKKVSRCPSKMASLTRAALDSSETESGSSRTAFNYRVTRLEGYDTSRH